jgi:hypothetical protein
MLPEKGLLLATIVAQILAPVMAGHDPAIHQK